MRAKNTSHSSNRFAAKPAATLPADTATGARSIPSLDVVVTPSRLYAAGSLLLHLAAGWSILHSTVPLPLVTALVILIVISLKYSIAHSQSTYTILWHANGLIEVGSPTVTRSGVLITKSYQSYLVVILVIRTSSGYIHRCVIPRDSVSDSAYRKVRARLQLLSPQ